MGTEFPWRWGRGAISANLDVIWGMSVETVELALKHTSQCSESILRELCEIGKDNL